jgi:3,4-dihydroxy 2-butanone 4-phosphate synthase/GTP cyclohydrolase II
MSRTDFTRLQQGIDALRRGGMIVLVDDEDRENEGDLVVAAEHCTAEHVNFMSRFGRGLICLALTAERVRELDLAMMVPTDPGDMGTAFTVSVEARRGVTTGISAADRAETIRVATRPEFGARDLVSPGHVFPLRAQPGGVLVRSGHTEGSIDLARLAGALPAGVICEIIRDDGTMARMDDLEVFAREHGLPILTIAELIEYRLQRELLVERVESRPWTPGGLGLAGLAAAGEWTLHVFRGTVRPEAYYVAITLGDLDAAGDAPVLVRAQRAQLLGDVFGAGDDSAGRMRDALTAIAAAGRGALLYVVGQGLRDVERLLFGEDRAPGEEGERAHGEVMRMKPAERGFREFGLGAQVLRALGLRRITVLTDHPRKIVGVAGFGIEVVGTRSLAPDAGDGAAAEEPRGR